MVPSRREGFGLIAVEAMRSGKASIVSDQGALPELVCDEETGFIFEVGESSSLDLILAKLDRGTLSRMGQAAKRRFIHNFTAERMNRGILEVYKKVGSSRRPEEVERTQRTSTA